MRNAYHSGPLLPLSEEWTQHAACRGVGISSFFNNTTGQMDRARRKYCAVCPVIDECGNYAIMTRSVGLWGGVIRKRS